MFISQRFLRNSEASNDGGSGGEIKTNEQIDKQNEFRKTQGLDPLPYANTPAPLASSLSVIDQFRADKTKELTENNTSGLTPEQITEEAEKLVRAEADRIKLEQDEAAKVARIEAEKNGTGNVIKIAAKPVEAPKAADEPKDDEDDIAEEKLLKSLSKKMGREIKSLDELTNTPAAAALTPEEKEAKIQERENAKLNFALQNKKISKAEIESFITDSKDKEAVAYNFYAAQQLELDKNLTDKAIRESFEEAYGLDEEVDSLKYKLGQRQMEFVANSIIEKKHAKYLGLESEYAAFETAQTQKLQYEKDVLSKAPIFKKDVAAAASKVTKVTLAGYDIELEKEILDGYVAQMLTPAYTERAIANGYTLDGLETALKNSAIMDNLENIVSSILETDRIKNRAGQRGVIPAKNVVAQNVLSEKQQGNREDLQQRLGMTAN